MPIPKKSQLTCVRGEPGLGKTLLLKWLFDLEKSRNRKVAWFSCEPNQTVDDFLDSIRSQLGIRIQPGQDKTQLVTKLPTGKISIFVDNAHYMDSISTWLSKVPPNLAIIFWSEIFVDFKISYFSRENVKNSAFDQLIDNWVDVRKRYRQTFKNVSAVTGFT